MNEPAFPAAYACAAAHWQIESTSALIAYLWSWIENQVMAALKAVPLGQTDGQKILLALGARLESIAQAAATRADSELGNFAPGVALLSSRHETQYSRLFRS
jgi:urease accessory protein